MKYMKLSVNSYTSRIYMQKSDQTYQSRRTTVAQIKSYFELSFDTHTVFHPVIFEVHYLIHPSDMIVSLSSAKLFYVPRVVFHTDLLFLTMYILIAMSLKEFISASRNSRVKMLIRPIVNCEISFKGQEKRRSKTIVNRYGTNQGKLN